MRISDWSSDVCSSDLLFERKQDVGFRADHQRAADVQGGQSAQYIAASVFTQVEPVHRAAEIEVAVGVELAHESSGMAFQIALDLKLHAKRIVLARFAVQPHAAEAARSEEHTSELQSLTGRLYAVFSMHNKSHPAPHQQQT